MLLLTDNKFAIRIVQIILDKVLNGFDSLQRSEQTLKNKLIRELYANYSTSIFVQSIQNVFVLIQLTHRLCHKWSVLELFLATLSSISKENLRVVQIEFEETIRQFVSRQCLSSGLIEY